MPRLSPASNPLALSLYELERMVACSPTWQGLLNTTDWTVARDQIAFVEDDTDPAGFPRPTCVISMNNPVEYAQIGFGTGNFLRPNGDLWIYFGVDVPDEYLLTAGSTAVDQQSIRKNQLQFMANTIGGFVDDLAVLAGTDQTVDSLVASSHLGIPRIRVMDFARNPETTWASMGQFWYAIISVMWGDQ